MGRLPTNLPKMRRENLMTIKVTKESLIMRIAYMSSRPLSLNEEYQLAAY